MIKLLLSALLLWITPVPWLNAQVLQNEALQLDFYLITVEVGDMVADNFGHTGIRVKNEATGTDYFFNWGVYDFRDPVHFSVKFYLGDLDYKLGVYPFRYLVPQYRPFGRTMWQDRLLLSDAEKTALWQRLTWNNLPENRTYQYQYFFDNCSTRPRDYLNDALGGAVKTQYHEKPSGLSFRDMVRSHYESNPFVSLSLELLMNANLDREMNEWEHMFLPKTLRKNLLDFRRADGTKVLEFDQELLPEGGPKPLPLSGGQYLMILVGGLWAIVGGLWLAAHKTGRQRVGRVAYRILGLGSVVFGIYFGLVGLLMPLNWIFSGHPDLYHNANMLLVLPFDGFIGLIGLHWLVKGEACVLKGWLAWVRWYFAGHLLVTVLGTVLFASGVIAQDLSVTLTYVMPLMLIYCGFILKTGRAGMGYPHHRP